MPRTYVAADRTLLANNFNVYTRVEVKDSTGAWIDLTAYTGGRNYFLSATWQRDVNQPVMSGTLTFLREVLGYSLAPTITSSPLNIIAAAYDPLLAAGHAVRVSTACTSLGGTPVAGDWKEMFIGRIDDPDWGGDDGTIKVTISDLGAWLLGQNIDTARQYAASTGTALETVMQSILTDNTNSILGAVTLYTPVSPSWNIKTYTQAKGSVLSALQALAAQIGWDVRYQYDASNVYRLTLLQPPRSKVTTDLTFPASAYYGIPTIVPNSGDIRTRIGGSYIDATTKVRTFRYVQSVAAITNQVGVRYMEVNEDASSNIDTSTEMDRMLNAILSDLESPSATHVAELPYFWMVELGDLVQWSANSVHYDTAQALGVTAISWTLDAAGEATTITCRGKASGPGSYWISAQLGGTVFSNVAPPTPHISFVSQSISSVTVQLDAVDNARSVALQWQTRLTVGSVPGAWSALSSVALPQNLSVTRDVFYSTLVELRVVQGDGQTATASLAVDPSLPGIRPDLGKIDRTVPQSDGYYSIRGSDTLGIRIESSVGDSRAALMNNHFRYNSDSLAGVLDGGGFNRTAATHVDGSGRPFRVTTTDGGTGAQFGSRSANSTPADYGVGVWQEFKQRLSIGAPGSETYGQLTTIKPYVDNSGGYATQQFKSADGVFKREGGNSDTSWGAWRYQIESNTQRIDRTSGHLDVTMADSRTALMNNHFRYSTDTAAGVVENTVQSFAYPGSLDGTRRVIYLRDNALSVDVAGSSYNDGRLRSVAGFRDQNGGLATIANDTRSALVNAMGRFNVDALDGWLDTANYRKPTPLQVGRTAIASGGIKFNEVFEVLPGLPESQWNADAGSPSLVSGQGHLMGHYAVRNTGYLQLSMKDSIPFNPAKLYRMRARVRAAVNNTAGGSLMYIGLYALDASNTATNSNSGASYVCAGGATPVVGNWTEYVGWFKGATQPYASGAGGLSADPRTPAPLNVNTTQIRPLLYIGYAGSGGTFYVDYVIIDEFDEDASLRLYSTVQSDNATLYGTVKDTRAALLNAHFRYGTDSAAGVLETGSQYFISPNALTTGTRAINFAGTAFDNKNLGYINRSGSNGTAANIVVQQLSDVGHAVSTMQDSRAALVNAMFRLNTDSLAGVLDGGGYQRPTISQVNLTNRYNATITDGSGSAQNLVENGGFDIPPGEGDYVALGWENPQQTATYASQRDTSAARLQGDACLLLSVGANSAFGGGVFSAVFMRKMVRAIPGQVYRLSGWMDNQQNVAFPGSTTGYSQILVRVFYSNSTSSDPSGTPQVSGITNGVWTKKSTTFTVPNPPSGAYIIGMKAYCIAVGQGTVATTGNGQAFDSRFDGVELVRVSESDSEVVRSGTDATPIGTVVQNVTNAGHAGSAMQDARAALLNNHFRRSGDDLSSVLDGSGYNRSSSAYVDGFGRTASIYDGTLAVLVSGPNMNDGRLRAVAGFRDQTGGFASIANDTRGSLVNNAFRKSGDDLNSVLDGGGFRRTYTGEADQITQGSQNLAPAPMASPTLIYGSRGYLVSLAALGLVVGDVVSFGGLLSAASAADSPQPFYFYLQTRDAAQSVISELDALAPLTNTTALQYAKNEGAVIPTGCVYLTIGFYPSARASGGSSRSMTLNRGPKLLSWTDAPFRLNRETGSDLPAGTLVAGMYDARGSLVNNAFRKSGDDLASVLDGSGFRRTSASYVDGSNRVSVLYDYALAVDVGGNDFNDGKRRAQAGFRDFTGGLGTSANDQRGSLLTTHGRLSTDTLDNWLDSSNYQKATPLQVARTDAVSGAVSVNEAFEIVPGAAASAWTAAGYTPSLIAGAGSTMGKNIVRGAGYMSLVYKEYLPFNPNKLYRIRARVRNAVLNTVSTSNMYIGVIGYDSTNTATNNNGGNSYVCSPGTVPSAGVWTEFVGWVKGATTAYTVGPGSSGSAAAPTPLNVNTTQIRPQMYLGYNGSGGTIEVDYYIIDEFDEDGSARTYNTIASDTITLLAAVRDNRSAVINNHFRYATDGAAGIVESAAQSFVNQAYVDGTRRPVYLWDGVQGTSFGGNTLNVAGQRAIGGLTNTTGGLVNTASDTRGALVNNAFRLNADGLGSVLDSGGYSRTSTQQASQITDTGIADTAYIGSMSAQRLGLSAGSSIFSETFEHYPGAYWADFGYGVGTRTTPTGIAGTKGQYVLQTVGQGSGQFTDRIPYNPASLYRVRIRVRQTVDATGNAFYAGMISFDENGTNQGVPYAWSIASNEAMTVARGWVIFEAWFSGFSGASNPLSRDPLAPAGMPNPSWTTASFAPGFICNYAGAAGGTSTQQIDYITIDEYNTDNTQRTYGAIDVGKNLRANVQAPNGATTRRLVSGRRARMTGFQNAGGYTFSTNLESAPVIVVSGGVSYEPGSFWGTAAQADANAGAGGLAPAGARQVDELVAYNVTIADFKVRARMRQSGGATTLRTDAPLSAAAITTIGGSTTYTSANAPSYDDGYTLAYSYAFSKVGGLRDSSINATVSFDYYNGTQYVSTATATYSASDAGTSYGGSGTSSVSGSDTLPASVSARVATSSWRIILQSVTTFGTGTRTLSLTPGNLTYNTSAADSYATKTPNGTNITVTCDISGGE